MKFAVALSRALRNASLKPVHRFHYRVSGELITELTVAEVEVVIPWRFCELKRVPPTAHCSSSWMRNHADWHNSSSMGMCWVIPTEWSDAMGWKGKPVSHIVDEGVQWMLASMKSLIDRHYYAELEGLTEWNPQWSQWSHYAAGLRQYEQSKQRK